MACAGDFNKEAAGFICPYIVLFLVISVSLFNLSLGDPAARDIWLVLLSSAFGIAVPAPKLGKRKGTTVNHVEPTR